MQNQDISQALQEHVKQAIKARQAICIRGGGSKDFYGREPFGEVLNVSPHRGIVSYEPTELVITARAGTPLREIEETLAQSRQMLAFEPPAFGKQATLGGTIACNLSGPRRPYTGAARDFVLGVKILNGKGEILSFGGEVMKNVAGYDVSRLMTGAMGTLGILLEVSLKVLPRPEKQLSLVHHEMQPDAALEIIHRWSALPLPVSAVCYYEKQLHVRLSGTGGAIRAAHNSMGGQAMDERASGEYWRLVKEHRHTFFTGDRPLWRLSVASDTPQMSLNGAWLHEWNGAQRWLVSDETPQAIREAAARAGGHATLYRNGQNRQDVFHPLPGPLMKIQLRLKQAFDPAGILNPGRMYERPGKH
jgi:glycolate oxidase FAD binding subunit